MDLFVQLLFLLALLNSFLKMSQWGFIAQLMMISLIGGGTYWVYPWMIEQSKQQLDVWIKDPELMQSLATIQMIEALAFIIIDLHIIQSFFGKELKRGMAYANFFQGCIVGAAILYIQMITFYEFSHIIDFEILAVIFSAGAAVVFIILPYLIKQLIPEAYLRMELRYILSLGQIICSIIITIFCQKLPYTPTSSSIDFLPLLLLLSLVIGMGMLGWLWSIIKNKFKWKF